MDDTQIEDLKQFISATVSQTEARLGDKIQTLDKKVDDGFAGVGEAIEEIHKDIETRDTKFDTRLTSLEQAS